MHIKISIHTLLLLFIFQNVKYAEGFLSRRYFVEEVLFKETYFPGNFSHYKKLHILIIHIFVQACVQYILASPQKFKHAV